jgi:hypothetical protein
MSPALFLSGIRALSDEGGGRLLMGDNKDGGVFMLWPI